MPPKKINQNFYIIDTCKCSKSQITDHPEVYKKINKRKGHKFKRGWLGGQGRSWRVERDSVERVQRGYIYVTNPQIKTKIMFIFYLH